jgi:P pilus assembly chaperone PapD
MSILKFTNRTAKFIIPALIAGASLTGKANAQGSLLVTPNRIVFDKNASIKEVTIANTGNDQATVIITPKQYKMTEDGGFEEISVNEAGQNFAVDYIRYYPKKITLAPHKSQTVKIEVIGRERLTNAEYRSYLNFKTEAKNASNVTLDDKTISATLVPSFGITIPVIIKAGDLAATVQISDVMLKENRQLSLVFNRTGSASVYGDLNIEHVSPNGKVTKLSPVKGIAVYTPNALRRFSVDLSKEKADLTSGILRIVYKAQRDEKSKTLAATELNLNQ